MLVRQHSQVCSLRYTCAIFMLPNWSICSRFDSKNGTGLMLQQSSLSQRIKASLIIGKPNKDGGEGSTVTRESFVWRCHLGHWSTTLHFPACNTQTPVGKTEEAVLRYLPNMSHKHTHTLSCSLVLSFTQLQTTVRTQVLWLMGESDSAEWLLCWWQGRVKEGQASCLWSLCRGVQ